MAGRGRYRERKVPGPGGQPFPIGRKFSVNLKTGATSNEDVVEAQLSASLVYSSEWERCWDTTHGRPPYRTGDSFLKTIIRIPNSVQGSGEYTRSFSTSGSTTFRNVYSGGFTDPYIPGNLNVAGLVNLFGSTVMNDDGSFTTSDEFNPDDLDGLGDRAFDVLRPKIEVANVAQSLYELREAPEMIRTTARGFVDTYRLMGGRPSGNTMRFVGSKGKPALEGLRAENHFLNHTFGWVPFVKDVVAVCDATLSYDHYRQRAERRNNVWMKRYFAEPVESDENLFYEDTASNAWRVDPAPFVRTLPGWRSSYRITKRVSTQIWYEGSFRSYYPEFDNNVKMHPAVRQVRQALTLYGARINPVVLWKVTPFSWLVDWFSNTGSLIQRAQDALTDSNVSRYVYVMRHRHYEYLFRQTFTTIDGARGDMVWSLGGEAKLRARATSPFEFRLRTGGLTAKQGAILAALGLSWLR